MYDYTVQFTKLTVVCTIPKSSNYVQYLIIEERSHCQVYSLSVFKLSAVLFKFCFYRVYLYVKLKTDLTLKMLNSLPITS